MSEAFGGDGFIEAELHRLVAKWEVKTIVETGTHLGDSTKALAQMGPAVYTIEGDRGLWEAGKYLERLDNVGRILGDSGQLLNLLLEAKGLVMPALFYLDAHWGPHSPLLDELWQIAEIPGPVIIAIHDFFNPFHEEYGFDTWDIGAYRLELIEPALKKIYGAGGYRHWYNDQAEGLKRGIIYIEPKEEL